MTKQTEGKKKEADKNTKPDKKPTYSQEAADAIKPMSGAKREAHEKTVAEKAEKKKTKALESEYNKRLQDVKDFQALCRSPGWKKIRDYNLVLAKAAKKDCCAGPPKDIVKNQATLFVTENMIAPITAAVDHLNALWQRDELPLFTAGKPTVKATFHQENWSVDIQYPDATPKKDPKGKEGTKET